MGHPLPSMHQHMPALQFAPPLHVFMFWLLLQVWLAWDASANQYIPAEGQVGASTAAAQPDSTAGAANFSSHPADSASAAEGTAAALPGMEAYVPVPASQPAADLAGGPVATPAATGPGTEPKKPPVRRRGATIGSAPQLSQEGIQAALRQAEVDCVMGDRPSMTWLWRMLCSGNPSTQ